MDLNSSRLALGLLVAAWALAVAVMLLRFRFGDGPAFSVDSSLATFHMLALLVAGSYSVKLNIPLMERSGRAFHLSLPVSPLDRVVARWLVVGVIVPVVATVVALLAHGIALGLARLLLDVPTVWEPAVALGRLAPISLSWALVTPLVLLMHFYSLRDAVAPRRVRSWLVTGLLLAVVISLFYATERASRQIEARTGVAIARQQVFPAVPGLPHQDSATPVLSPPAEAAVAGLRPWLHLQWYVFWLGILPAFCLLTARASLRELED
jgi:hypothetical protein